MGWRESILWRKNRQKLNRKSGKILRRCVFQYRIDKSILFSDSIFIPKIYAGAMYSSTRTSKVYLLQLPCTQRTALKAGPLKPKLLCGLYDIVAFTVEICFLLLQMLSFLANLGNGCVLPRIFRPLKEVAYCKLWPF